MSDQPLFPHGEPPAAAQPTSEFVERYIAALPWSERSTDDECSLVAGNIRGFAQALREATTPDPLQGLRNAKYLNPTCASDGCQWLCPANIAERLEADMQDQPLRLWDGIRYAIEIIKAQAVAPAASQLAELQSDERCWEHRPGRLGGHARRCIRETGHEGEHIDAEKMYWTTAVAPAAALSPTQREDEEVFAQIVVRDGKVVVEKPESSALSPSEEPNEEMVPHAFNSRTRYEPGDDRDIWCKDCEYHREHDIHKASAPLSPAASEIRRIADNVLHDHMPPDAFKEAAERLARYVLSLSPTPAPRWRDRQKPGTCGMKMVELADAAPYWSRDELYNLATSIYLSENRDKLRELIHQLAAQLYEARSEAAVSALGSLQPPSSEKP